MITMTRTLFLAGLISIVFYSCKDDSKLQSEIDEELIREYIADNNLTMQRHSTGVYYKILKTGNGSNPSTSSRISVRYTGRLMNGTEFDSGELEEFLYGLIPGWQVGIPLIKSGGRIQLIIPSGLAYGNRQVGSIPPNSILIFDIDLIDFI